MSAVNLTQQKAATRARLILGDAEEFETVRQANFPGMDNSDLYLKHRPQMVILANTSSVRIKAYTILWNAGTADYPAGRQWVASFMQSHCMPTSSLRHVEPGGMRLLTVSLNVSPAEHKLAGNRTDFSRRHLNHLAPDEAISVSIDAAIYSDGTIEGLDTKGLLAIYKAKRNAEHDEAVSLNHHILKGARTRGELTEILTSHARWNEDMHQEPQGVYWSARRGEAKRLLARLNSGGVPHLETCIARRLAYSPVRVKTN